MELQPVVPFPTKKKWQILYYGGNFILVLTQAMISWVIYFSFRTYICKVVPYQSEKLQFQVDANPCKELLSLLQLSWKTKPERLKDRREEAVLKHPSISVLHKCKHLDVVTKLRESHTNTEALEYSRPADPPPTNMTVHPECQKSLTTIWVKELNSLILFTEY